MESLIASDNASVAAKIREAIGRAGQDVSAPRVVSHDAALRALSGSNLSVARIIFFCSSGFGQSEVALLQQISEVTKEHAKLVGVGPLLPPQRILEIIRAGAADYLDVESEEAFGSALVAVLHRLTVGKMTNTTGKMFAVFGPSGGSGASFLALNIAAALAVPEEPCGLIDLHVRGGDLARLLNASPRYTLASLAGKVGQLDATLFEQALFEHECGIRLLASPELFGDYRLITLELVQKVVQLARSVLPHVVVDLEDVEHAEQVKVLSASDRVILSLRPDYVSLYRMKKHVDFLLQSKVASQQLVIVANRTGQSRELPLACMEEMLGLKIEHQIPNDPATANTAYNLGVPVVRSDPESAPAASIRRLARNLAGLSPGKLNGAESAGWSNRLRRWSNETYRAITGNQVPER